MANIHDPKHADYIAIPPVGTEITDKHPDFKKGMKLHNSGKLTFTFQGGSLGPDNPDGSVTDQIILNRTYTPNPKK